MKKEILPGNIVLLSLIFLCVTVFTSCDKRIHFDGTVISRHGVPTPNARIVVDLGHGEHSGGGGYIETSTDQNGKFNYNGKICNNCWASTISASSSDSGAISKTVNPKGASQIELQLK